MVYDESTADLQGLTSSQSVSLVMDALEKMGKCPFLLQGVSPHCRCKQFFLDEKRELLSVATSTMRTILLCMVKCVHVIVNVG